MTLTENPASPSTGAVSNTASTFAPSNVASIPELADHWKKLDLREILTRPAAFLSVSQSNSLYKPGGAQYGERHDLRGSLEATVRSVKAAQAADNFTSFNWVGYTVFRQDYPQTDFDRVQYDSWTGGLNASEEQIAWDNELVSELRELVRPGDNEFYECALQTAFTGTGLELELSRKRIEVLVITGIHTDWCIEGNARAARDHGYLPIVIGDATGCQTPEAEPATFQRINQFFAPVISSHTFVELLKR